MFGQQGGAVGTNKQICSYYLKGTCKYGSKCWNYHPANQAATPGVFGGTASVFGGKSGGQQDSKEFTDFVKQVSGEMNQWERSGQWLTSSFTPLKAHPLLQGFSDTSPEEFRVEAYTANKANTFQQYQAKWMEAQQRFKQLREALKVSLPEAVQALRDVYFNKSPLEQQQVLKQPGGGGLFGKTSSSVFGGGNSGAGLLGAAPQTSIFGTSSSSVFGGSSQSFKTPNVFGGGTAAPGTSKPVFGGQTSVFGGPSGSVFSSQGTGGTGVFGGASAQPQASSQGGSIFGQPPGQATSQTASVFGGSSGAATQSTPVNIFSHQNQQQQQSGGLFGTQQTAQQPQGGLFGGQQQAQQPSTSGGSLFGAQTQTQQTGGLFTAQTQPQTGGVFTSQPQTSTTFPTSVFSQQQPSTTGNPIFGNTQEGGTKSVFGGGGSSGSGWGLKTGIFGGSAVGEANPTPGLFSKPPETATPLQIPSLQGNHNYTPLDQLGPEDRAQFEAETFTYVPLCPPPIELCT